MVLFYHNGRGMVARFFGGISTPAASSRGRCDAQVRVKTRFKTASELHSFKHDLASSKGIELAFIWGHDWGSHFECVSGELLDWLVSGSSVSMYPLLSKLDSVIDEPCVKC